jgi:hypothetical protein
MVEEVMTEDKRVFLACIGDLFEYNHGHVLHEASINVELATLELGSHIGALERGDFACEMCFDVARLSVNDNANDLTMRLNTIVAQGIDGFDDLLLGFGIG